MSKDIPVDEYMRTASSYGTAIHKGMEDHIAWLAIDWWEYEPEVTKYCTYGIQFLNEYSVSCIHTEHYISTPHYQGTIDLVAEINWEKWVLDWKSWGIAQDILGTKWPKWKYKKPYDKLVKTSLQLSLYAYPLGIKNIWVVELSSDWFHFHKLKLIPKKDIEEIINNYYIT